MWVAGDDISQNHQNNIKLFIISGKNNSSLNGILLLFIYTLIYLLFTHFFIGCTNESPRILKHKS